MGDTCTQSKYLAGILNTPANTSLKWQKLCFSYSSSRFTELRADLKLCSDSKQQDMLKQWKKKKKPT